MTTITLESIQAAHEGVAKMIAQFKKQATPTFIFPETQIDLCPGEHYAGIILGKDGEASYHLILMDGKVDSINWANALQWAKELGGDLPTRRDQSLLFANLKEHFESAYYWSNEQHASSSDYAWYQTFEDGYQNYYGKSNELRARAVRRLVIQ